MKAWHGGLGLGVMAAAWGVMTLTAAPEPDAAAEVAATAAPTVSASPLALLSARTAPAPATARPPAPTPRLSDLDRFVADARRGDMHAAYAAWQVLSACVAPDEPDRPACPGLPASLLQERLRFLSNAALAGVPAAQIDFYMQGPDPQQAQDASALQAWRDQALAGLKSAATQCEPFAMGLLATLFDAGELMPRDETQAVAYAVAESQLRRRVASDANLRDRLAEPISDAALDAGRQLGLRQVGNCR